MLNRYVEQVRLLVGLLPYIAQEKAFALRGGTAINLFYRDMPRLSVDIDLTYLPVEDRDASLKHIDEALDRIMARMKEAGVQAHRIAGGDNQETRIMMSAGSVPKVVEIENGVTSR